MDPSRFDTVTRSLTKGRSRRGALTALLGGTLGLLDVAETAAKKGKGKGKKKKKKDGGQNGTQPPPPPPPPPPGSPADLAPTCDELINCGGDCPRCAISGGCGTRDDCASAFCLLGQCRACTSKTECDKDANGECYCAQPATGGSKVCTGKVVPPTVQSCASCPSGTVCLNDPVPGNFNCFKLCGVA